MKVLITGGAGFIGSHLVEILIARGDQVLVIDNYQTGRKDNLKEHKNLQIIEGTISDKTLVDSTFSDFCPDIVVHAAASYKDPDNWYEDVLTNELGTVNVVKASKNVGIKRLIYFQTSLCYGLKPLEQPITLNHPVRPEGSSYAISKTTGESYIKLSDLEYISFRLANVYGPRNLSGPLPTFYHRLTTGKTCFVMNTRRDFIFIDDLTAVIIKAIDGGGEKGVYHVSTGRDYSIKELFDSALKSLEIKLEKDVEVRERSEDDVFTILIDPSKTEKDFNWKAKTELEYGVNKAIAWYKVNGLTQTFTHLKNINEEKS